MTGSERQDVLPPSQAQIALALAIVKLKPVHIAVKGLKGHILEDFDYHLAQYSG